MSALAIKTGQAEEWIARLTAAAKLAQQVASVKRAEDAAAAEAAVGAKAWTDANDDEIETDDDWLLSYIREN